MNNYYWWFDHKQKLLTVEVLTVSKCTNKVTAIHGGLEEAKMGKAKTRSFSIFLLKKGFDASNALKDEHSLEKAVPAKALPPNASLFVLDNTPKDPWWKNYFQIQKSLQQTLKGAVVILPVNTRSFALTFGHVSHNLKETSYEYDFGLRVTLNSVDPLKLKSTDTLEPSDSRRQRTQLPIASDLTYFDFDRDSTILKSITGKVKKEHETLIKNASGASNLRISSAVTPTELKKLCEKLLTLYNNDEYKKTFPGIQNISPVRDPDTLESLNKKLVEAFRTRDENLYLTIPDIVDYRDNVWATFSGAGKSKIYDDIFIDRYYEYLKENDTPIETIGLEDLKTHNLRLTDEDGSPRDRYSILKSLIFDATLEKDQSVYHLTETNWYKVESYYITKIKNFLDPYCVSLMLPHYDHENEGSYNKSVASQNPQYICLDTTDISPTGQTQIEPCDLYSVSDGFADLVHVKISTLSAQLSHLFNQGTNSLSLIKSEAESAEKLEQLIEDNAPNGTATEFLAPLKSQRIKVTFAIVTHKDANKKSDNLPLFSRISLMRNIKELKRMTTDPSFGFVEDKSPKTEGKVKPRKKKSKKPSPSGATP